jgi:alginate O-acetyltransferase complex protein AlgI
MLFNSLQFVLFFLTVTILFYLLPHKFRWLLLLVASCYFYMAYVPVYILILGFTIVVDYFVGIYIEKSTGFNRRILLTVSLAANIGVLAFFKYYNFISYSIHSVLPFSNPAIPPVYSTMLLPIGLSFHTFQAMSYIIEVYRGKQKAERRFGIYALYVMFFPQLVAGPIERPQQLLPQLKSKHIFNVADVSAGLNQMLIGFIKKLVIADRLAISVDSIYDHSADQSGSALVLGTVFFAFQIYCDFSGYTDIAIGSAKILGFDLMKNFNRPYLATSFSQFWHRWHISLSTWFRDYVYFPLGGNRVSKDRLYFNLLVVFLISGLWHGAKWTFVIWGGLNGIMLVIESMFHSSIKSESWLRKIFKTGLTFVMICFTWVFFRADSVGEALYILKKIITFDSGIDSNEHFYYAYLAIGFLLFFEIVKEYKPDLLKGLPNTLVTRCAYYVTLMVIILQFGVLNGGQFIYFQF